MLMGVLVEKRKCVSCAGCISVCAFNALEFVDKYPENNEKCTDCGTCITFCPVGALKTAKKKI